MSRAVLFQFLCAQHVSDINISIIRSLRPFCWITTLVCVLGSACVGVSVWLGWRGIRVAGWSFSLQHGHHSNPAAPNIQHTKNREQNDRRGNSTTQSQAPDDGYVNVRNML